LALDRHAFEIDNTPLMDVTLALLADAANISQEGKLNILGSFDNINAPTLPFAHAQMCLVMRFSASRTEIGQQKQLEIALLDPDGAQLGTITGTFVVPDAPPGQRVAIGNILPLTNTVFTRGGDHHFAIMINGDEKQTVPIKITEPQPQGDLP